MVDVAEISGFFDGNLTVRDRLIVRATGKVGGFVQFRRLEVQDGGELSGDVRALVEKKDTAPVRKLESPANDRRDEKNRAAPMSGLRDGTTLQQSRRRPISREFAALTRKPLTRNDKIPVDGNATIPPRTARGAGNKIVR